MPAPTYSAPSDTWASGCVLQLSICPASLGSGSGFCGSDTSLGDSCSVYLVCESLGGRTCSWNKIFFLPWLMQLKHLNYVEWTENLCIGLSINFLETFSVSHVVTYLVVLQISPRLWFLSLAIRHRSSTAIPKHSCCKLKAGEIPPHPDTKSLRDWNRETVQSEGKENYLEQLSQHFNASFCIIIWIISIHHQDRGT